VIGPELTLVAGILRSHVSIPNEFNVYVNKYFCVANSSRYNVTGFRTLCVIVGLQVKSTAEAKREKIVRRGMEYSQQLMDLYLL
jgi:hypothetical protein